MNQNAEPDYQIEETNYYFDTESQNPVVVLKAKFREDENPVYISGTFQGCSITTEEIIAAKRDEVFYLKHLILELDYLNHRKEAAGKYCNLILEHIAQTVECSFKKLGKALVNINWIPPQCMIFINEKDWEQFKTGFDYLALYPDNTFHFLTKEDVFES